MSDNDICWMDLNGWGNVDYYDSAEEARECRILRGNEHCDKHSDPLSIRSLDCE